MVKKNTLIKLTGHPNRCGFSCVFANVCEFVYNNDDKNNTNIHWSNTRYDKSDKNSLDYIFTQKEVGEFDDVIKLGSNWSGININHSKVRNFFDVKPHTRPDFINEFNKKFWSTFSLNDDLIGRIKDLTTKKGDSKTLAVHIRRSDVLSEVYWKHLITWDINDLDYYYNSIKKEFEEGQYEKIFLCTEDDNIHKFLKTKFSEDILFTQETVRIGHDIIDYRSSLESLYTKDGKVILLDIMSDVIFASKCEGFLGTVFSGISIFIEVFNNNNFKKINYFK